MRAFEGVRVIDFTHVLAGPFCTYQLAVMGADVIKIESPDAPDMMRPEGLSEAMSNEGRGAQFICQNGNKRSLCLDLNSENGKAIVRKMIAQADVLVENYRGGVLERQGFGYEAVRQINPQLIYCSMTGFGRTGPKAEHPAYDNVIQAFSGLMAATGTPTQHPVRVGPAVLDYGTGAQAAFAVAAALFQRTQTKTGQRIDVSMADAALMLMSTHVMDTQTLGQTPDPFGNQHPERASYSLYDTSNGQLMIGAFTPKQTSRMWRALGEDGIAEQVLDYSRQQLKDASLEQRQNLQTLLLGNDADHWEQLLMAEGVPAARVRRIDETIDHPQIKSRQVLQQSDVMPETGQQLRSPVAAFGYQHDGPELQTPSPVLGQHSSQVLEELGYTQEQISDFIDQGDVLSHATNQ